MEEKKGLFSRLRDGLTKTRENLFLRVFHGEEVVDESFYEELEESMILADMGMRTSGKLLDSLRSELRGKQIIKRSEAKEALITSPQHCIIKGPHPSPLSAHRGFFGGRYFSKTNEFLEEHGIQPIDWRIRE